jgi:hypothetical protein
MISPNIRIGSSQNLVLDSKYCVLCLLNVALNGDVGWEINMCNKNSFVDLRSKSRQGKQVPVVLLILLG